jgi:hypothetical protein
MRLHAAPRMIVIREVVARGYDSTPCALPLPSIFIYFLNISHILRPLAHGHIKVGGVLEK